MRFVLDRNIITCIPSKPFDHPKLKIANHSLYFNKTPNTLPKPDVLALICILAFYPYVIQQQTIEFPMPVSLKLRKILDLHKINCKINISDREVEKYQERSVALSWGGGLDSWGCYLLQPELYKILIHEDQTGSPLPKTDLNIVHLKSNLSEIFRYKKNDQPGKWICWPAVLISSLWYSAEYKLTSIALGGNLGSVFLNNGIKYHPTHLKPSKWYDTFRIIDMPIYLPLAGLTDLGVVKIIGTKLNKLKYCWFSSTNGSNCHQCPKCLRKDLLIGGSNCSIDMDFAGPSYKYLRDNDKNLGRWVYDYYGPALELVPFGREKLVMDLECKGIKVIDRKLNYMVEHFGNALKQF